MSVSELRPGEGTTCFDCPVQRFRYSSTVSGDSGQAYPYCGIVRLQQRHNLGQSREIVSLVLAKYMFEKREGVDTERIPRDCRLGMGTGI